MRTALAWARDTEGAKPERKGATKSKRRRPASKKTGARKGAK
jgi:hypothetical protein